MQVELGRVVQERDWVEAWKHECGFMFFRTGNIV
jgi:hypothetical protein